MDQYLQNNSTKNKNEKFLLKKKEDDEFDDYDKYLKKDEDELINEKNDLGTI